MFGNSLPFGAALVAGTILFANPSSAAVFVVDSADNSSTGGAGLATLAVTAGDRIRISSSTDDLWSLDALPRFSDGNGLSGARFATASDDSGQPVGTLIGASFGLWNQNGLSAPFGVLVGEIGGVYKPLGANRYVTAWGSGTLNLFAWDSNRADNSGSIAFDVSVVPEPATWALMVAGFGMLGTGLRRRRGVSSATA